MTPAQNTTAYIQGFEDGERFTKAKILQEMESDKREWVGLTEEERHEILVNAAHHKWDDRKIVKDIEARLKEKNT
jgi:hypothetical protein